MFLIKKQNPTPDMSYSCELSPTCKSVTFEFKIYFKAPGRVSTDSISRSVTSEARGLFNSFVTDHGRFFGHGTIYKMDFSKDRLTPGQRSRYYGCLTIPLKEIPRTMDTIAGAFEDRLKRLDETINNKLKTNGTVI